MYVQVLGTAHLTGGFTHSGGRSSVASPIIWSYFANITKIWNLHSTTKMSGWLHHWEAMGAAWRFSLVVEIFPSTLTIKKTINF